MNSEKALKKHDFKRKILEKFEEFFQKQEIELF
jgi:hypothetical protein